MPNKLNYRFIFNYCLSSLPCSILSRTFLDFFYANNASGRLTWQHNDADTYVCVLLALKAQMSLNNDVSKAQWLPQKEKSSIMISGKHNNYCLL